MTRRRIFLLCFALLAAVTATIFLAIAVDHGVYAPGAYSVHKELSQHAHVSNVEKQLPPLAQRWLSPFRVLRKAYSVVAFAIVGFFVAPLLRRPYRIRSDAAIVAGFSGLIEIAQKTVAGSTEGYASNAFDVLCGALGGLIGALLWNAIMHRRPRADAAP